MKHDMNYFSILYGFCFHFTGVKYLIAGGGCNQCLDFMEQLCSATEVVELVKSNNTPSFAQIPFGTIYAVGAAHAKLADDFLL